MRVSATSVRDPAHALFCVRIEKCDVRARGYNVSYMHSFGLGKSWTLITYFISLHAIEGGGGGSKSKVLKADPPPPAPARRERRSKEKKEGS